MITDPRDLLLVLIFCWISAGVVVWAARWIWDTGYQCILDNRDESGLDYLMFMVGEFYLHATLWPKQLRQWRRHNIVFRFDRIWNQELERIAQEDLIEEEKEEILKESEDAVDKLSEGTVQIPSNR